MKSSYAAILLSTALIASAPLLAQQPASSPASSPAPAPTSTPASTNPVPANTITMGSRTVAVPANSQVSTPSPTTLNPAPRPASTVPPTNVSTPNSTLANTATSNPTTTGTVPPATNLTPTGTIPNTTPLNYPVSVVQQAPAGAGGLMSLDTNNDGLLTKAEFMTYYERQFDAMKKNTVGAVDLRRMQEEQTAQNE